MNKVNTTVDANVNPLTADADKGKSDTSDEEKGTAQDLVDRSELNKVISQRDATKEKYRDLESKHDELRNQFESLKVSVESKKIDNAKASGDVEALEKSFTAALETEKEKLLKVQESADTWKSKYMDTMIESKVKETASEILGDYNTLFIQIYKERFQLSDDDSIKVKDDIRPLADIVKEFGEKHNLKKNTVKSGMGASAGDGTKVTNFDNVTKGDIEKMSQADLRKLAFKNPQALTNYQAGKLD